jgi:hypothetical protein
MLSYSGGVGILIGPLPRSGIPFLRSSRFGHSCFYLQVDPPMDLRSDRHATVDESTMFCNIVNIIIQFDSITIFILLRWQVPGSIVFYFRYRETSVERAVEATAKTTTFRLLYRDDNCSFLPSAHPKMLCSCPWHYRMVADQTFRYSPRETFRSRMFGDSQQRCARVMASVLSRRIYHRLSPSVLAQLESMNLPNSDGFPFLVFPDQRSTTGRQPAYMVSFDGATKHTIRVYLMKSSASIPALA